MKMENLKDKFKVICIKVGKRNFIIAGAVLKPFCVLKYGIKADIIIKGANELKELI